MVESMAKALDFTPRAPSSEEKLNERMQQSADALSDSLLLLQELHQHGVLDLLVKLVRGGEGLADSTMKILGSDSSLNIIRNAVEVLKIADQVDPKELEDLGRAVGAGVAQGARNVREGHTVTLPELLGLLRDPDVQAALSALVGLLKGAGRSLRETSER